MPEAPLILWFRQDLRLDDHAALAAAAASGRPIIPIYVLDDETPGRWSIGGASRWWLAGSLAALAADIGRTGGRLVLRHGRADEVLLDLAQAVGATAIYFSRCYEPYNVELERRLAEVCGERDIDCRRFAGGLLFEPEQIRTGAGQPYRVFTPFYKACLTAPEPADPIDRPLQPHWSNGELASDDLADWRLRPAGPDWAGGLRALWTPGEAGANARLADFLADGIAGYREARDFPARPGTARLSPHLHFGEISPRRLWHRVRGYQVAAGDAAAKSAEAFLRELIWREFSTHLLFHWPDLPEKAFKPAFDRMAWDDDPAALRGWRRGRTGYPIVDAGLRELWQTGYMHNRVRMIVASFLVKDLMVDWRAGEVWFWDTLCDADLANNAASWQWVAGSGADAAPYFRIFNPVTQGRKFDPDGTYVRRYVPELAKLPDKFLHAPFEAPPHVLKRAGVTLGETYPLPLVDHAAARQRALDRYEPIKAGN